jgi:hypothetical protein
MLRSIAGTYENGIVQLTEIPLNQIQSLSLRENETAGFGLKWDFSDRSNANREYCVIEINDIEDRKNTPVK